MNHAILSAIGTDRVGIVDDLTTLILRKNCNVEESRMAVLGGEFAVILLLSGEDKAVTETIRDLPAAGADLGLNISVRETGPPKSDPKARPYQLESVSLDSPGIVHAITALLRVFKVNIEDLETDTTPAPWTGAPMFIMRARITVPSTTSLSRLREELEDLESEHNLDIKLIPISVTQVEY